MKGFVSYSHDDAALFKKLKDHLGFLKDVTLWTDQEILAGDTWDAKIIGELAKADLILLCVSASFWASRYIQTKELSHAKSRHAAGTALIIPVIMKRCLWQADPFLASLSAVPLYGKPVQEWSPQDKGLTDACSRIRESVEAHRLAGAAP